MPPPRLLPLLLLLLWSAGCCAQGPCCPGDNVYSVDTSACHLGDNETLLNCSHHGGSFLLDPVAEPADAFNISAEGHLLNIELKIIAPHSGFCVTRLLKRDDGVVSPEPAALVCFDEVVEQVDPSKTWLFVYGCCLCVSAAFLLAALLVYLLLPQLWDLQGRSLMCAVASLCVGEACLGVVQLHDKGISDIGACVAMAFLIYFWMMSAFFWMSVIAFNMWRTVVFSNARVNESRLFTYYSVYGWGAPVVFLVATLITHHVPGDHIHPNFASKSCWFGGSLETWTYFNGPMAVLITCNIIFFMWTSWRLWKDYRNTSTTRLRAMRFKCLLYLKLFIIMGIPWICELLSIMFNGNTGFWVVLDVVNCLQGIFIFAVMILRKRVLQALANSRPLGLPWPKRWAAGVDQESETMLAEEVQLDSNHANN